MRTISIDERRARLGRRHLLGHRAETVEAVVNGLLALHGTDPATIYLSTMARMEKPSLASVDHALFARRTMMRTLAMRRTLWVPTTQFLTIVEASSSGDIATTERKRLEKFLVESSIDDPRGWLEEAATEVLTALESGPLAARDITEAVPRLATKIIMGAGTKHETTAGATSRTLGLMAVEGLLARGKPSGAWTGRGYVWHRRDQWLPHASNVPDSDVASAELVRAWLQRFGPAPLSDVQWWTGWTKTKARKALAQLDLTEVGLEGQEDLGLILSDDLDPVESPDPWVCLLPALDPTSMGWKQRDWYVGGNEGPLFDRFGNIGPTVWMDGRIVGGWGQNKSGELAWSLFEKLDAPAHRLLQSEVDRLHELMDGAIVKPSFPTPLQKSIAKQEAHGHIELA